MTNLVKILDTDPALSIPAPDPIGRLYRKPGTAPLEVNAKGGVIVPRKRELFNLVMDGTYLPSITNIIDVINKPYLIGWAARHAANCSLDFMGEKAGNIEYALKNRGKAAKYFSTSHDRDVYKAQQKGTRVHLACELIGQGKELSELGRTLGGALDSPLTDIEMECIAGFQSWCDRWQPEFLAHEATVFGDAGGLGYAGTTDFIAKINGRVVAGDYKVTRSGLHNEVALQLTAITRATTFTTDQVTVTDNYVAEAAIAVHLSENGYTIKQARIDDEMWRVFCGLRAAWNFKAFGGEDLKGMPLGRSLVSPESTNFDM